MQNMLKFEIYQEINLKKIIILIDFLSINIT